MCLLFIFWRLRGPREGSQFTRSLGSSATTWKSTYEPGRQVLFCDVYYCVTSLALGYWLVTKENSFLNTHTVVCGLNPLWKWALQAEELKDRAAFFWEGLLASRICFSFLNSRHSSGQGVGMGEHLHLQAGHCSGQHCQGQSDPGHGMLFFRD